MQQSTTEYESFRDDAVAIINGAAVTVSVMAFWTRPAYMAILALVIAIIALLFNAQQGYSLV